MEASIYKIPPTGDSLKLFRDWAEKKIVIHKEYIQALNMFDKINE